jgi:hypothetical protein
MPTTVGWINAPHIIIPVYGISSSQLVDPLEAQCASAAGHPSGKSIPAGPGDNKHSIRTSSRKLVRPHRGPRFSRSITIARTFMSAGYRSASS